MGVSQKSSLKFIAALICLFSTNQVMAQAPAEDIDQVNLEDLMNLDVTSASKIKQKQSKAPSIISVIPRSQFEAQGWFTLNDAMSAQAGFFPSQDYDRTSIGSRGLYEGWNNNHILLLMDGVPFNDPMYGTAYTWENTPIFMIKSVEVIRGPGSALYGSNATNGVISVQTLSGKDFNGRAQGRVRLGSARSSWLEAATGNVVGNFNYFTSFSSHSTNGNSYDSYDGSGRTDTAGDLAKFRVRDDRAAKYFLFKVEGENELKGLSLQFHDQSWDYQTGHGWLFSIPDFPDSMKEDRRVLTLSYKPELSSSVTADFTLKYERKNLDWNTRYAPDDYLGTYPNGIWESARFDFDHYFGRGQASWDLGQQASLLGGVEASAFVYRGDRAHFSNTDLAGGTYAPNAGDKTQSAPGILGLIENKPISTVGVYTQLVTGDRIWSRLPITLGLRYDLQDVKYDATKIGETGEGSRTFHQLSPRIAAVLEATDRLNFKFLAGRAFRAPAPSELAGSNTWALSNNIKNLSPETVSTLETASDWQVTDRVNWRVNAYYTKFEDQIGYNQSQANLSTNIYTTSTIGAESELNYALPRGRVFGNLSWAKRVEEDVTDTSIVPDQSNVTWAPALTANVGGSHDILAGLNGSLLAQFMGEVKRKASDSVDAANVAKRGSELPAWVNLNAGLHYQIFAETELSAFVKNALDQKGHLLKNRDYAFDYKVQGRSYYVSLTHKF